jgi:hypothetical protein
MARCWRALRQNEVPLQTELSESMSVVNVESLAQASTEIFQANPCNPQKLPERAQ